MFQTISHKFISPKPGKSIENAGNVQHYDDNMMSKLAPKREMEICVSECPNMFWTMKVAWRAPVNHELRKLNHVWRGITPVEGLE